MELCGLALLFLKNRSGKLSLFFGLLAVVMWAAIRSQYIPVATIAPIGSWMAGTFFPHLKGWDGIAASLYCTLFPIWIPLIFAGVFSLVAVIQIARENAR